MREQATYGAQFKIYPRGFLGAQLPPRIEQKQELQENNTGFKPVKVNTFHRPSAVQDYSQVVEELYASYIKAAPDVGSFKFRRKVLRAALQAFGDNNFHFWYCSQFSSPVLGGLQRKFLDDCLHFVSEGRRDMSLETWQAILEITNNEGAAAGYSSYAQQFFGMQPDRSVVSNISLIEVLQRWCGQPNGQEDLLGTLHILFGSV